MSNTGNSSNKATTPSANNTTITAVTYRATSATLTVGSAFATLNHPLYAINLSGLNPPYVSGETLFDEYLASRPTHDAGHANLEFWSRNGETETTFVFYLGQEPVTISGFAIWNVEDGSGTFQGTMRFGHQALTGPFDDAFTFTPDANVAGQDYPGQAFLLPTPVAANFVELEMKECTAKWEAATYCALGEIVWRVDLENENS